MNRKIIVAALLVVACLIACTATSCAAKKHDGVTYKIAKVHGKYVTTFYASGEQTARIVTKKKMPVKFMAAGKVTRSKLLKRCNKYLLVEVVEGTCLNDNGDGKDGQGYYISYRGIDGCQTGDVYRTYLIYANSRYVDDIAGRCDYCIDHRDDTAGEIVCPNCDGTAHDCPYWFTDTDGAVRHMTAQEIAEFEWLEGHYQDADGNWCER